MMQVLMVRIQVIYKFVVNNFSYLSPFSHKEDVSFKFILIDFDVRGWHVTGAWGKYTDMLIRGRRPMLEVSPCSLYYRNHNRLHERSCELAMILSSLYTDRTGLVNAQKIQGRILDSYCMRETLAHLLA